MKQSVFYSKSAKDTIKFAKRLSGFLKARDMIGFIGNLGSGKTTFIKGLAKGLGFNKAVSSPSFVILKIYPIVRKGAKEDKFMSLYHFDLYRLKNVKELEDVGYEDFASSNGICVIEWADRAKCLLPKEHLKIEIRIGKDNIRNIKLSGYGQRFASLVNVMEKEIGGKGWI